MPYMLLILTSGQVHKTWPVIHWAVEMPLLFTAEADHLNVNKTESGVKSTLITSVNAITSRAIADTTRPGDLLHRDNSADGEIRKKIIMQKLQVNKPEE